MKKLTAVLLSTALLHSFNILSMGTEEPTKQPRKKVVTAPESTATIAPQLTPAQLLVQNPTGDVQPKQTEGQPVLQTTANGAATVVTKKEEDKKEKTASVIESEPSWLSRLSERWCDTTALGLWIVSELEKGKKENLIHKTHQVDRAILDSITKEQQTAKEHIQSNTIDRLQATLRKNLPHQNNLKTMLEGSVKHKLQLNDGALNNVFDLCNTVKAQEVEYLKAVAEESKLRLELTQKIQTHILQLKPVQDKAVPANDYATIHTVLSDIKSLQ